MNLPDNLIWLRKSKGITQKEFATSICAKPTTVCSWEKGVSNPDLATILRIAKFFDVSLDTLLSESAQNQNIISKSQHDHSIPFYNIPISAGALGVLCQDKDKKEPDGYIDIPEFRGCKSAFRVTGVSMEPIILNKDYIAIKPIENISTSWDFLQTGKIYLIITHEDRMIKYIKQASDPDYILCESPNYATFKVFKGDILELYQVTAYIRSLT